MKDILATVTAGIVERSLDGAIRLSELKYEPRIVRLTQRVSILLTPITKKRDERLRLLTLLYGRPIHTTYNLTVAEARAFIALFQVAPQQFTVYLINLKKENSNG